MDDTTAQGTGAGSRRAAGTEQWDSWLSDYQAGNYDRLPHDEITQHYTDWSRSAAPDEAYEATRYGYGQLPPEQFGGASEGLYSYTQEQGLDLSDLELSSADYQQWTPDDAARVTRHAYGRSDTQVKPDQAGKPEKKSGGVPKPVIGLALAGALAFAASRVMGGHDDKKDAKPASDTADSTVTVDLPAGTGGTEATGYTASSSATLTADANRLDRGPGGASGSLSSGTASGLGSGVSGGPAGGLGSSTSTSLGGTTGSSSGTSLGSSAALPSSGGVEETTTYRGVDSDSSGSSGSGGTGGAAGGTTLR